MSDTCVLIAETDSPWLPWARAWHRPEHDFVLLVQDREETHRSFFERVEHRFAQLTREGRTLDRVVLVGGSGWDSARLAARAHGVRKLLARFAQDGQHTELLLDPGSQPGLSARGMKAIAASIADCAGNNTPRLRVAASPAALQQAAMAA